MIYDCYIRILFTVSTAAMASPSQTNDSLAVTELRSKKIPNALMPNKDQHFLLYFIIGSYFGPDLKGEKCHKIEDIARFARLTGIGDFSLDRDAARLHGSLDSENLYVVPVQVAEPTGDLSHLGSFLGSQKARRLQDIFRFRDQHFRIPPPIKSTSSTDAAMTSKAPVLTKHETCSTKNDGAAMLFFPSPPTGEELANMAAATKSGAALTGSAAMGQVGPIIGLMDIAECEDSYMFRVSLPGVKRDERNSLPIISLFLLLYCLCYIKVATLCAAGEFSCEVENDGKVVIRGVTTTGEKTVYRFSQMFEMLSQNLCPPGHFSISFQLPGRVDPQQFSGNFGTDGILEGIVMKKRHI
ncbi:HSP20-like chaperones superfamily protein, putative [Theobroma cacao]|uniref:HSP20-like chaperones superfamily protein, putative n=1 Tax=Theobroma cacao TaxID=3641 RepID=A0A061F2U8_THECC|nr:HSP20-like chaperones superfamily protein, putative [Theobroma cacao]